MSEPEAPLYAATLVPAAGVAAIPHLRAFLPECGRIVAKARPSGGIDSVAGWGFKPTARYARQLAARHGWPYLALEDGFLRSIGLGEAGSPPLSLIVDDLGVYYDARGPSRLETLLEQGGWETDLLRERARACIDRLVESGITKTNASAPMAPNLLPWTGRRRVLVIDQTAGDASITGGMATDATFARMLAVAQRDETGAEIVVRRHPAVAAGLKKGCLPAEALAGTTVLDADCRAADILQRVDVVYTVSSLTGFEALIRGLPVRCFGMPFYAGWGATRDEMAHQGRSRRRSAQEIFAAACLVMSRYVDPLNGEATTAEATIERLIAWRERADRHAGYTACLGYAPWKHGSARTLLNSPRGETGFFSNAPSAIRAAQARAKDGAPGRVVFWAGRETPALSAALAKASVPVLRMEDGFIRSRGLGSDFHRAASVALDDLGVYYDATRPSRLETILETSLFEPDELRRAADLRRRLVAAGLSKYNLWTPEAPPPAWPAERFKLLVVGQVENDKSIIKGCESVRTNQGLLEAARHAHPEAFIIYKTHPDVASGNRPGVVAADALARLADTVVETLDIDACLTYSDGLATMTSLAGFEALLRDKPVWTFGRPFYAGWGLTIDALGFTRRSRRLSIEQLVAGALIVYPIYVHPPTGLPCEAEDLVTFLELDRNRAPASERKRLRYWRAVLESLRPSPQTKY